jgi:soluble lytic murein transglycosylase
VRATRLLGELGETGLAGTFLIELASSLDDPVEIALAGQLARDFGIPHVALRMGKIAAARNRPVPELAFLTGVVPDFPSHGAPVERALVHAVARQESSFNAAAVSPAGARGLMQLMPATAKRTARAFDLAYSPDRLTTDPAYNAAMGAAHLGQLVAEYAGSYVMTIAAYNAGGPRVKQWVAAFGDPRRAQVDPIDWIERIPFSETRNYVQRVLENLQVYRARLNGDTHPIELVADLTRGRASGVRRQ